VSNIYFDNAATTQIDQSVIDIMSSVMTNNYGIQIQLIVLVDLLEP